MQCNQMEEDVMLYLTRYSPDLPVPVYRVWASGVVGEGHVLIDHWVPENENTCVLCIVELDPELACIMALKGHRLFKVRDVVVHPHTSLFNGHAYMLDIDATMAYVKEYIY